MVKNLPATAAEAGGAGSIPGSGRSPGEGNGNPLQYSSLENSWAKETGRLQSTGSQRMRNDQGMHVCVCVCMGTHTHTQSINTQTSNKQHN